MTFPVLAEYDRAAAERTRRDLLAEARAAAGTRVVVVAADRAPLSAPDRLAWVAPQDVPDEAEWGFLGRDAAGAAVLVAAFAAHSDDLFPAAGGWAALRAVGASLHRAETAALIDAVSLGRWLVDAPFCPACGARCAVETGGWSRRCPSCGREHFPRTDPAVIVAITSPTDPDALLLGSNAMWEANRFSCFAGFVEAGESLEAAVHREVREESGVEVTGVRYRGSQAWPYPRSLMLGFLATATDDDAAEADGEEILTVRWFTRAEIGAALAGEGPWALPGPASIAHRLISDWHAEHP